MTLRWKRCRAGHYQAGRYHVQQLPGYKMPWELFVIGDYGTEDHITGRSYATASDAKEAAEEYETAYQAALQLDRGGVIEWHQNSGLTKRTAS